LFQPRAKTFFTYPPSVLPRSCCCCAGAGVDAEGLASNLPLPAMCLSSPADRPPIDSPWRLALAAVNTSSQQPAACNQQCSPRAAAINRAPRSQLGRLVSRAPSQQLRPLPCPAPRTCSPPCSRCTRRGLDPFGETHRILEKKVGRSPTFTPAA
jgi:hypothetical protein